MNSTQERLPLVGRDFPADLTRLSLLEAQQALRRGEIRAVELLESYLARIARLDPSLNLYLQVMPDEARTTAESLDLAFSQKRPLGLLHGIPVALKDLIDMRGARTTAGSRILANNLPAADAAVVERLRQAGAVVLGKLNLHEFAYGATNENPHYGRTRNPWKPEHLTGGSSGGSAAAVSARLCAAALGTDTGGSVRIPAALCGVTGLKPTFGRVSVRGVFPLSWSNDHVGVIARDAVGIAQILQVIAGYDSADSLSLAQPVPIYTDSRPHLSDVRVAGPAGYWEEGVHAEIQSAVERVLEVLARLGAERVYPPPLNGQAMFKANRTLLGAEAAALHQGWLSARPDEYGADVRNRLENGARISAPEYIAAKRSQLELRRQAELWFEKVDLLVTPSTRLAAPLAGSQDPVRMASDLTALTAPFNLVGFPALSLPCGFTLDGLPIGVQLVTRPWNEALLLQVGQLYQTNTDWHLRTVPM